ncbi:E3 ubiquitin-protein ligase dtx3L [Mortierella sp. GBA43]|nr:E3 ubiquitin-protein ligase dtx3L [Mortierella sp. GBA43]
MYPIVIGDDEYGSHHNLDSDDALSTHADDDALSTQANDDASVVEVNEGSPEPSVISLGRGMSRRDPSPVVSHVSDETDQTITPDMTLVDVDEERPTTSRRNDPDEDEVIEVIDLTRPERRDNYPRGDSLPRVPGFTPQHSFQLPTLQRLVSRSSESMERSQRRSTQTLSSIDVHEIPDDDDENGGNNDEDRFGNDTVRIDSQVREVQLDPHHPWARGPIQLILSPEPPERHQYAEDQRQRRLEDATLLDDHLVQIDYNDAESENDLSQEAEQEQEREGATTEDDGVTDEQVQAEVNGILSLRREPRTPTTESLSHIQSEHDPWNEGVTVLQITQGADSNDKQEVIECWYMENLRCSICIEVMEIPTMIKCGHAFCRACIDKAMESSRTCPMCRNPVNRSKMIELEFMLQERPASGGSSTTTGPTTTTTTNA